MEYTVRLKEKYNDTIKGQLTEKFGYKSVMSVPKLKKIVLSQGVGEAVADKKIIDSAVADLSLIAGQKAMATFSKKILAQVLRLKPVKVNSRFALAIDD
jgi:large subunit ribosomal protein L5